MSDLEEVIRKHFGHLDTSININVEFCVKEIQSHIKQQEIKLLDKVKLKKYKVLNRHIMHPEALKHFIGIEDGYGRAVEDLETLIENLKLNNGRE